MRTCWAVDNSEMALTMSLMAYTVPVDTPTREAIAYPEIPAFRSVLICFSFLWLIMLIGRRSVQLVDVTYRSQMSVRHFSNARNHHPK